MRPPSLPLSHLFSIIQESQCQLISLPRIETTVFSDHSQWTKDKQMDGKGMISVYSVYTFIRLSLCYPFIYLTYPFFFIELTYLHI